MARPILFTTTARLPLLEPLTQPKANRILFEHHAEATRRGLPTRSPRIRTEQDGDVMAYHLDYRAPRSH